MESPEVPTPAAAAAALADAESGRDRLAGQVVVPPLFLPSLGAAIAVQIATAAVGVAVMEPWAVWLLIAGVAVFVGVSAFQLIAFRRLNGIWLGGMVSKVFGGTATQATLGYCAALGG